VSAVSGVVKPASLLTTRAKDTPRSFRRFERHLAIPTGPVLSISVVHIPGACQGWLIRFGGYPFKSMHTSGLAGLQKKQMFVKVTQM
jgi:hypothetical protein